MPVSRTVCNRDCPDCCSILLETDSQGRAVKLKGDPNDPVTRGFLCERTSRFLARQNSPDRFTRPMWRPQRGQELQPVSWEFALDWVAQRLRACREESGAASIFHYRSGGSMGLLMQLSDYLFEAFGPVSIKRGDICSGAGEAAQEADFGICESHDLFDLKNSRGIVLWGKNVHTSSPHLLPLLLEARQKGVRLLGVDPVRTRLASIVDDFLQPRPGEDFALAMAAAHDFVTAPLDPDPASFCDHWDEYRAMVLSRSQQAWAEQAGVSLEQVGALVSLLRNRPAAIQVGWGMGRRRWGGAVIRAVDSLAAISGNLGIPGGGASYYFGRRSAYDSLPLGGLKVAPRSFSEARFGPEVLAAQDPPVRLIWVTAGNPASMLPDSLAVRRALEQTETVVVVDTHPTDTTDLADLVLPTLTLLEDDDLLGAYGNHFLRASSPVLEAPGEARHELWIWQELATRLGLGDILQGTPREWKERMTRRLAEVGITVDRLEREAVANPFARPVLFEGLKFPTVNGKMQLIHECPEFSPLDAEYPLRLAAFSTPKSQASQWSVPVDDHCQARIHPNQAQGLQDGELVLLETPTSSLPVRVRLDEGVHPLLVVLDKGGMGRLGGCPNQLISAEETDIGGGANFYDQPVRLQKSLRRI